MSYRFLSLGFIILFAVSACGNDSRGPRTPAGPGPMGGPGGSVSPGTPMGPMGGSGPMGGGMAMTVASEFDYLVQMIPHHVEAIQVATVLQARSPRREMREFAATIIATQSAEVRQMEAWLAEWYPGRETTVAYRPMMRDISGLTGDAVDRTFLEDMIPHHMMAVMMSQQLITRGLAVHPEVNPFAATIRDTQQAEIRMMSVWLRAWFGSGF
ncbi:MAG: DUF305 domain-containing protein [Vicinamibacterales bacterium]